MRPGLEAPAGPGIHQRRVRPASGDEATRQAGPDPASPRTGRQVHGSSAQGREGARHVKSGPHRTRQRCFGPVCNRLSASQLVKTASSDAGGGFDGTRRAGTRSDGRKHCRNNADGCGEDRASDSRVSGVGGGLVRYEAAVEGSPVIP